MTVAYIEVFEWEEGEARPGAKVSRPCLDMLAVPSGGQIPQEGDVVLLNTENPGEMPVPYRVVSRELMWFRSPRDDSQTPAQWSKMWIHVRRMSKAEYEREA